jgi:hypothetical protein
MRQLVRLSCQTPEASRERTGWELSKQETLNLRDLYFCGWQRHTEGHCLSSTWNGRQEPVSEAKIFGLFQAELLRYITPFSTL